MSNFSDGICIIFPIAHVLLWFYCGSGECFGFAALDLVTGTFVFSAYGISFTFLVEGGVGQIENFVERPFA